VLALGVFWVAVESAKQANVDAFVGALRERLNRTTPFGFKQVCN
jgi:hypothetical protein